MIGQRRWDWTRDIVTVASMIQRETLHRKKGKKVASVIYNRLADGMKLQIDATVQYMLWESRSPCFYPIRSGSRFSLQYV